jgi:hypothetical protein
VSDAFFAAIVINITAGAWYYFLARKDDARADRRIARATFHIAVAILMYMAAVLP